LVLDDIQAKKTGFRRTPKEAAHSGFTEDRFNASNVGRATYFQNTVFPEK